MFQDSAPFLEVLMLRYGKKITYNDIVLQEEKVGINTCGRYCGLFLRNSAKTSLVKFVQTLRDYSYARGISHDQAIVELTRDFL